MCTAVCDWSGLWLGVVCEYVYAGSGGEDCECTGTDPWCDDDSDESVTEDCACCGCSECVAEGDDFVEG